MKILATRLMYDRPEGLVERRELEFVSTSTSAYGQSVPDVRPVQYRLVRRWEVISWNEYNRFVSHEEVTK